MGRGEKLKTKEKQRERERGCPKALNLHRLQWDPLTFYGCLHVELSYFWANLLFCLENVVACHMFMRAIFCLNSPVSVVSLFERIKRGRTSPSVESLNTKARDHWLLFQINFLLLNYPPHRK